MTYKIFPPSELRQTILLPASKSISNRALIIHALSGGEDVPENLSKCDDTDVMVAALHDMPYEINIKAAGTAMRFMTAYLSVTEGEHIITGTDRMKHRPISVLVDALRSLGADIEYVGEEGFPPLKIKGSALEGGELHIPGNVSSQYISALLMIAPMMQHGLKLHLVGDIISRSYIELTISMMTEYGASVEWIDVDIIDVRPQPYKSRPYYIENDWSAASYWYEMMALTADDDAEIHMPGLMGGSSQGDTIVKYIYSLLGVKTVFDTKQQRVPATITLRHSNMCLPRMKFDFSNCPDLTQTVVCTCCGLGIPFDFTGLSTLKIKETDRIEALKTELRKLGFAIRSVNDNELIWDGERCEPIMEPIDTYEDHRMAMAFAPLAMRFSSLQINDPEVVSKSYPNYWKDLEQSRFIIR